VDNPFRSIIQNCLEKDPRRRPDYEALLKSAQQLAAKLGFSLPKPQVENVEAEELYAEAQSFVALGDSQRALAAIKTYTQEFPENHCGWTEFGRILLELGRWEESIGPTRHSIDLNFWNAHPWNNLGVACHRLGRLKQAVEAFESAVLIDPNNTGALMQLGFVCAELGMAARSTQVLQRALALRPTKETLLFNAGNAAALLVKNGHALEALPLLERLIEVRSKDQDAQNLAIVYDSLNRKHDALSLYLQLLERPDPSEFVANAVLRLSSHVGDFVSALRACDVLLRLEPGNLKHVVRRAQCIDALGRFAEADSLIAETLKSNANEDTLWFIRAVINERNKRPAEATAYAERAMKLLRDNGKIGTEDFRMALRLRNHCKRLGLT
jgi:tetratricopeptide (TPR) repeat protein